MNPPNTNTSPDDFSRNADQAQDASVHAERFAKGQARFGEFLSSVKALVAMLRAHRAGEFAMSWKEIALLVSVLLYVVNPFDAVPEAAFGPVGLTDDAAAIVLAVGALSSAVMRFRAQAPDAATR